MSSVIARSSVILRITLKEAVNGYWDYGAKQVFDWRIDRYGLGPDAGYTRVGSHDANRWFWVRNGETEKQTLANALRRLRWFDNHRGRRLQPLIEKYEYIEA